ncbi:MAG: HAMP domain-containing histidine kinase [Gammaproteobacteria bacterium]|nr:HAMP domain-containing histidine kinase [Gammaproteobacteria bacterium]
MAYIPGKKNSNPYKRIELLEKHIDRLNDLHKKQTEALITSFANHIELLGSFTHHDLKNSIHSIDGILEINTPEKISDEVSSEIFVHLEAIRKTAQTFTKLVDASETCSLEHLILAIKTLNRSKFKANNIEFIVDDVSFTVTFKIDFISLFQMINNVVLNAISVLESNAKDRKIRVIIDKDDKYVFIYIYDNGKVIEDKMREKIFEHGFTTKEDGTGVGLSHVTRMCDHVGGNIQLIQPVDKQDYTKAFLIKLLIVE